jgi:hypothetical protein
LHQIKENPFDPRDTLAMTHVYRIQADRNLATFLFTGKLTVAEGADLFLAYVRDPAFDPRHTMLCDARGVTEIEASFLSIFTRVARLAPQLAAFRQPVLSVVLVGNETVFGYVRMLEQILDMTTVIKMRPVWTEDEAMTLAGLTDAPFDALFAAQP